MGGYKAGMTHVVKYFERREGKKLIKKDIVHSCSVVECPPMKIIGLVGYINTPRGLRTFKTVWANKLDQNVKRRFYKNWYMAKKKAFETGYQKKVANGVTKREITQIKKYCTTVRVLCATQIHMLNFRQRKAHIMEIQLNGGSISDKVEWAQGKFGRKSASVRSSRTTSALIPSVLPRVTEPRVLSPVSRLAAFPVSPIEVSVRSVVSVPGIPLPSSGRSLVLVNTVTIAVPSSTRRSTVLVLVLSVALRTTPRLPTMPSRRTSPPWVVSLITVKSTKISCSSRVVLSVSASAPLLSASLSSPPSRSGRPKTSKLSSSTPHLRWVTVASRPTRKSTRPSAPLPTRTASDLE